MQDIDTNEHYGFAFSPSNPDLREAVNTVFAQIVADGTYAGDLRQVLPAGLHRRGVQADGLTDGRTVEEGSAQIARGPPRLIGGEPMAITEAPALEPDVAPDVRGPTAPLPATILALGIASLVVIALGVVVSPD